jgi:hypothetical protein
MRRNALNSTHASRIYVCVLNTLQNDRLKHSDNSEQQYQNVFVAT